MALAISTITDAIKNLSVSGLTIKDMDEVPQALTNRDCPVLVPDMDKFVSGFAVTNDTFGSASTQKRTVKYTLTYVLIYAQVGTGRVTVIENYSGMVEKAFLFIDTVLATDSISGAVDHMVGTVGNFGIITWGKTTFHMCNVSIAIQEFIN